LPIANCFFDCGAQAPSPAMKDFDFEPIANQRLEANG
jgi:hypothetical protein